MWLVSSMLKVPKPEASPAANWTSAGRIAAAATLVLGAAFPFASHLMGPINPTIAWLHWVADHPDLANLSKVFELLQMPFLFGTVLVYVLLSRQRSPASHTPAGSSLGAPSLACRRCTVMRRSRTRSPRTTASI
jgi:hypothetical protein